jgi:hypothetical protein
MVVSIHNKNKERKSRLSADILTKDKLLEIRGILSTDMSAKNLQKRW